LIYNNRQKLEIGILAKRLGINKQLHLASIPLYVEGGEMDWSDCEALPVPYVSDDENCLSSAVKIALSGMALRGSGGLGAEPRAFEIIGLDVGKIECK
jgi:hypothetical protein